jgi:16S rRNA (cytosine1402-N4)-methyltransferase
MSHISVLLHETIDALLADRHTGIYVDATFGRGGHSRLLLSKLDANSRVYAFDKDPQALAVAAELEQQDPRFKIIHASFADIQQELTALGLHEVDGIMADLGVSSPQLDQAERGFSFMQDGPLDMRMDNSKGQTASEWLMQIEEEALANIIFQYGEERYSRRIARAIKQAGKFVQLPSSLKLSKLPIRSGKKTSMLPRVLSKPFVLRLIKNSMILNSFYHKRLICCQHMGVWP